MKALVLGGTGKLGQAFAACLSERHQVVALGSADLDACCIDQVLRYVDEFGFDLVVNCVGLIGVAACEQDPARALLLNATLPRRLARQARGNGTLLVHVSTDALFDGTRGGEPYFEDDAPSPVNIYGLTKHAGDLAVLDEGERVYVARVGILFGRTRKNTQIFERTIESARNGTRLFRLATDIVSSPTYSFDAAREVVRWVDIEYEFGLHHVINEGKASIFDFVGRGLRNLGFDVCIEPTSRREFPLPARTSLMTPLASRTIRLRPWEQALDEFCSLASDDLSAAAMARRHHV